MQDENGRYVSPPVGNQITCVLHGISPELIDNRGYLSGCIRRALKKEGFHVLSVIDHKFEGQGYTKLVLLSESHIALHNYPERNAIYVELYSCRGPNDGLRTMEYVIRAINPERVQYDEKKIAIDEDTARGLGFNIEDTQQKLSGLEQRISKL